MKTAGVSEPFILFFSVSNFELHFTDTHYLSSTLFKPMKCENLQFNLPLYLDGVLDDHERLSIEEHLPVCPLCRQRLSEYRELRNDMRMVSTPEIPGELLQSVRSAIAVELDSPAIRITTAPRERFWDKFTYWLMPYSVGTFSALVLSFLVLSVLVTTKDATDKLVAQNNSIDSPILLADSNTKGIEETLTLPADYTSVALGERTPQINPTGALFALTESIARGGMDDDEVVLVADVFGNGLARIAEVIEPPKSSRAMREIEKAFRTNPEKAPFLPPKLKHASNAVRTVVKINHVDVIFVDDKDSGNQNLE